MVEKQILAFLKMVPSLTQEEIAIAANTTRYRVRQVIAAIKEGRITHEEAEKMSPEELTAAIYLQKPVAPLGTDFDGQKWLILYKSRERVSKIYVWREHYCPEMIDKGIQPLSYSQFCHRLNNFEKEHVKDITMPINRVPGKELYIDWCGDKVQIIDETTKQAKYVYVFVTALGDSGYPFAEAFSTMTQIDWNQAHLDAFEYYGGVPRVLVPDNAKTAVSDRKLYDTKLNESYCQLSRHYSVAIIPARSYKPQDKGLVENTVGWLENNLYPWLEDRSPFADLPGLNRAIQKRIEELSNLSYSKRNGTRKTVFEELDQPQLRQLPKFTYDFYETFKATAGNDYLVKCGEYYYSVPYQFARKKVSIHLYSKKVEIWADEERIALHPRSYTGPRKVIDPEHMAPNHKERYLYLQHDGEYYRSQAMALGENIYTVICCFLQDGPVEEEGYRSCDGVLKLAEKHGREEVDEACKEAISIQSVNYTTIKNLLFNMGQSPDAPGLNKKKKTVNHENVRQDWS